MEIKQICEGNKTTLLIDGRIDTVASPLLEKELNTIGEECTELVLDFANVEYISSACLRVLLVEKKSMKPGSTIAIINANKVVKEVFAMTGFDKFIQVL